MVSYEGNVIVIDLPFSSIVGTTFTLPIVTMEPNKKLKYSSLIATVLEIKRPVNLIFSEP